jgi:phosphatidate phosphatase APP1
MGHSPEARSGAGWLERVQLLARDFAELRRDIKRRLGILAPLRIAMYGGHGTTHQVWLSGRVLEEREAEAPRLEDGRFLNFKRAFRQFESDEVAGVELAVQLGPRGSAVEASNGEVRVVTDESGYFSLCHRFASPVGPGWLPVRARVMSAPYAATTLPSAEARVLIPSPNARFGVISDIDDTILQTYVQNRPRMVYLTLVGNPLTRLSFEGTTELYRGLRECGNGAPFFYVSKSMWNLFPLLERFITHQHLPRGRLLLRRLHWFGPRPSVPHKQKAIRELLETYPSLPFLLIGDSGERDLELYLEAARSHPGRVPAILIRNVSPARQHEALEQMARELAPEGCRVLVFEDTQHAIQLCTELGFWQPAALQSLPPPPDAPDVGSSGLELELEPALVSGPQGRKE